MLRAEDLLLSMKSLLELQKMQAGMEGRDFDVPDAIAAVRPALESVLGELLDLQRAGTASNVCPACGHTDEVSIEDLFYDYDNLDVQEIIDEIDNLTTEDLKALHTYEKRGQARGSILSKVQSAFAAKSSGEPLEDEATSTEETERELDKMFDDLFRG